MSGFRGPPSALTGESAHEPHEEVELFTQPEFGQRLRKLRKQQGKSQAELTGERMSAAYLSRLESGQRPPTERAVAYLAERLGVPLESFEAEPEDSLTEAMAAVATRSEGEMDMECVTILAEALDAADDTDPVMRWHALAQLARAYEALGDFAGQREALADLTVLSDELDRPLLRVRARLRLARCARNLGDAVAARHAVREVLAFSERYGVRVSATDLVRGKLVLASAEAELGDLSEAARLVDDARATLDSAEGALAAEVLWTAATVSTRQGSHDRAFAYLREAMGAIDSRHDLLLWIRLRLAAASLSMQAMPPRLTEAESFLTEVEPLLRVTGSLRHWQELLFLRAKLAFDQGDDERAAALADQVEAGSQLLLHRDRIRFKALRGVLDLRAGDQEARQRLERLVAEAEQAGMPQLATEVWRTVAESLLYRSGRFAQPAAAGAHDGPGASATGL
ncbi:helix-turn-helix domain-containing protein [Streptomyces sp. SBT349]|uniref:helix-turn-helix domain-containing protein n=1 Tax=Streptomyces sp. SBT349 TaxID=1580539 RepID=UPI00099B9293|nr:helix-turn-helix domain-containing protein [Streptomyces sp. SBT349]